MKLVGHLLVCTTLILSCYCLSFYYSSNPSCNGQKSSKFILSTLEDVSMLRCALMCDSEVMCVFVSYNTDTRVCYLQTHPLYDFHKNAISDANYICLFPKDFLESWVKNILASSESFLNYFSIYMKGAMDYIPWMTAKNSTAFVEFDIAMEMYVDRMFIYTIRQVNFSVISVQSPDGNWMAVWSGPQVQPISQMYITFCPELKVTNFKTSKFRFDIYRFDGTWMIDAVKVVGKENQRLRD